MTQKATVEVTCQCGCGETFLARPYDIKRGRAKYKDNSHRTRAYHKLGIFKYDRDQSGPSNPNWRGGQTICTKGYRMVYCPDHPGAGKSGYIMEHRLVAEQMLGRYLEPDENLMVLKVGDHSRLHWAIRQGYGKEATA